MNAYDLMNMLEDACFKTYEEWKTFSEKAYAIFEKLPQDQQEIIIQDNSFEMLSMIMAAYEEEDINRVGQLNIALDEK